MFRKGSVLGFLFLVIFAGSVFSYDCDRTSEAEAVAMKVLESLAKGDVEAIKQMCLSRMVKDWKEHEPAFKRMVAVLPKGTEPEWAGVVGEKCYMQSPGYERFLILFCYPNTGFGADITLELENNTWKLRNLSLKSNNAIIRRCREEKGSF